MPHVIRKYISNRGSALFMVLSTMTALLISSMAMYFSMVSSRSAQYAVFNHTQAMQSADSIAQIVYRSIGNVGNQASTGGGVLLEKMKALGVGESITTDADAFESMNPTSSGAKGKADADQLGAYSVIITRLEDGSSGAPRYDLNVMSSVDGNRDSVHYIFSYDESLEVDDGGEAGDMKLFTATGYLPNDAYINGGYYLTDVFYDTQFTYMNFFSGIDGQNFIGYNLYTGGDFCVGSGVNTMIKANKTDILPAQDTNKIGPIKWGIRGNFTFNYNQDFDVRSGSRIIVGGDLSNTSGGGNSFFAHNNSGYVGGSSTEPVYIYVNGDLNLASTITLKNVYLYINGTATGEVEPSGSNNRIFMTDPSKGTGLSIRNANGMTIETWDSSAPGMSLAEAMAELDNETKTIAYPKWELASSLNGAEHITINLNATNSAATVGGEALDAYQGVYYICYGDSNNDTSKSKSASLLKSVGGNEQGVIGKKFVIDDINVNGGHDVSRAIVIDTGDDPKNIITLQVKGNYKDNKYFMWFPESWIGQQNNALRSVILKGRGTVLIDIPQNVIYQNDDPLYVMHYGWFSIAGGEEYLENNHTQFKIPNIQSTTKGIGSKVAKFIHRECSGSGCCNYTREASKDSTGADEKCPIHPDTTIIKVVCTGCAGGADGHGQVATYCPQCNPEKSAISDADANWCANHVNKTELLNYYNTLSGDEKARWQGKDSQIVYPTTNFFLVSIDESADIRVAMSDKEDGGTLDTMNTPFFGFIYAPYMMYQAYNSTQNAGMVKLCGGMIVSDYNIESDNSYIGCYPEMMPKQLAGIGGGTINGNLGGSTKSWKLNLR